MVGNPGELEEGGGWQQANGRQPSTGAFGLDHMPCTGVARDEPRGSGDHAIPSTSIIE
jgi:hypothetical protein